MKGASWRMAWVCGLTLAAGFWAPARAGTQVSLTFDDGLEEQLQVSDMLAPHGMTATFFVISSRIGLTGSFTLQDLHALQAAGHEIGGHTLTHADLANSTPETQRTEVCEDRRRLLTWGLSATSLAYPFGSDDLAVHQVVADCGYAAARDVRGLGDTCGTCPPAESIPPLSRFELRTPETVIRDHTLEDLQGWVLAAEATGGGWVPLVFHYVREDCSKYTYCVEPGTLRAFIDWLATRAAFGTQVRTVRDVLGAEERAAVHVVPAPPTVSLKNGSLESEEDGDGVPDCWQLGGRGRGLRAQPDSRAREGLTSFLVADESANAGRHQLAVLRDDGTCAPLLPEGEGRRVGVWYMANQEVRLIASFRMADGTWTGWQESDAFPASAEWMEATWMVPRPPPGAVGLSVGMAQEGAGWMVVDGFSIDQEPLPEPETTPTLTLSSPNGDERIVAGSSTEVTWGWTGAVPRVDLAWSTDSGASWRQVAAGIENSGRLLWQVPASGEAQAWLRVASSASPGVEDISDRPFVITRRPEGSSPAPAATGCTCAVGTGAADSLAMLVALYGARRRSRR